MISFRAFLFTITNGEGDRNETKSGIPDDGVVIDFYSS
ncbi:hypothetical protein QFZ80_005475 [Paenibacillus sp. V4I7]|nr:hypothetical protein [Paenibacillus sp. V4I7]MDQ0919852.1 hypothetical protein [Paenibacillus sp. V4I5]